MRLELMNKLARYPPLLIPRLSSRCCSLIRSFALLIRSNRILLAPMSTGGFIGLSLGSRAGGGCPRKKFYYYLVPNLNSRCLGGCLPCPAGLDWTGPDRTPSGCSTRVCLNEGGLLNFGPAGHQTEVQILPLQLAARPLVMNKHLGRIPTTCGCSSSSVNGSSPRVR